MAGFAKPLHLRLFLEGQEVPVVSAQVQFGLWAPATAAIQIVPIDEGLQFKPRTMVHLFYLEEPGPEFKAGSLGREALALGLDGALGDVAYKLFFAGEITGFSFVKTPMSRAIVLQCMDFSSYWDSLQATMMDYGPQGNAFTSKASLYASNEALFADVPTQNQAEKLRMWILGRAQTPGLENVGGLAGGILNMVEVLGGLRGHSLGVNDFFTIAEIRCHILGQICAEDGDNTAQRLLDVSVFFDWIFNNLQNQPGQVSLRDMMKLLCSYIYYSFVPNPVAKFDPSTGKKTVTYGPKDIALASHRNFAACAQVIRTATFVFPMSSGREIGLEEAQALGTDIRKTLLPKLQQMVTQVHIDTLLVDQANLLAGVVDKFVKVYSDTQQASEVKGQCAKMANELFDTFDRAAKIKVRQPGGSNTVDTTARLRTQIFRPDCYMAAPPVCNVIFPEQYSQLTYDRNFTNEVTRVEISFYNRVVGQDNLTAAHFVEPHLLDMSKAVVAQMANKWRILMDHELHTGIIAREEWLPDSFGHLRQPSGATAEKMKQATVSWTQRTGLHHFFKYRIGPRTMNIAGRFMPQLVCGFPALVIQKPFYLPNAVSKDIPPDKAIDRIMNSNNPAEELGAPPQFLGMVEGVSHAVSQDGGSSTLSLSHCRSHLGIDDEFVGTVLARVRTQQSVKNVVRYTLRYDDEKVQKSEKLKNFLLGCTPQNLPSVVPAPAMVRDVSSTEAEYMHITIEGGKKTTAKKTANVRSTTEKTAKKTAGNSSISAPDPFDAAGTTIHVPAQSGAITTGSPGTRGGIVKLIEVLPPYDVVEESVPGGAVSKFFRGVTVYEELRVTSLSSSPVPVEYVVQPSWLSTSYDNENIGPKVYRPFFGCDSIVDTISLGDVGSIPARQDEKGMYISPLEDDAALKARLQDAHNKRNFYSIEKSTNIIAYLYGRVKSGKADVSAFVDSFTRRPVATKLDLLGSYDLKIGFEGDVPVAAKGKLGFHTLSVHPEVVKKGKLIGLLDDPAIKMSRMNVAQRNAMAASYDVRAEKGARVQKYLDVLAKGARGYVG